MGWGEAGGIPGAGELVQNYLTDLCGRHERAKGARK